MKYPERVKITKVNKTSITFITHIQTDRQTSHYIDYATRPTHTNKGCKNPR